MADVWLTFVSITIEQWEDSFRDGIWKQLYLANNSLLWKCWSKVWVQGLGLLFIFYGESYFFFIFLGSLSKVYMLLLLFCRYSSSSEEKTNLRVYLSENSSSVRNFPGPIFAFSLANSSFFFADSFSISSNLSVAYLFSSVSLSVSYRLGRGKFLLFWWSML